MLFYKTFTRHLLSCLRRCRSLDWKDLYIASSFFVACCIFTYVAWNLGASGLFLFLYMFALCAVGMLMSCLNQLKVPNNSGETSPLAPQKQLEIHADNRHKQSTEKFKDIMTEALISSNDKLNEKTSTETNSANISGHQQNVLIDMDVSETQINTDGVSEDPITCIDRNYDPRVTLEQYATGPSPGGRHSREPDESGKEQSRDNRLSPLLRPFRQLPLTTEASAIFHVPLIATQDIQDHACSSTENSHVPISQSIQDAKIEKEELIPDMSSNFQQPIYQNLVALGKISSVSHRTEQFDSNENPSKSLEAVDDKNGDHELPSSVPVLKDKLKIYQRLRPFDSSERIYVNMTDLTDERCTEQCENHQFAKISDSSKDSKPVENPKNEFEPFLTSSMPLHYDRLDSYKRLETFASSERIYVNVQPLGENVDREQNVSSQFINKTNVNFPETENVSKISSATLSPPSEGIYMNLPNYLYEKQTCIKKKISRNRTAGSPPDPEMDSSKTEEHTLKTKNIASNRKDTKKSRLDNMHIPTFETTTKFHAEQKSMEVKSDISTVSKLTSPGNNLRNKNDSSNICSTKKTDEHNVLDQKIHSVSDFPLKGNETPPEDYFRVSKTKSSSNRHLRRGTSLGEYLSLSYQFEEHSRSRHDFKIANTPNIKPIKGNPIYGDNESVSKIEDEILSKIDERSNKTASADDSIALKMNTTHIVQSSSNNSLVPKNALSETFLVNEASNLSADFEKNSKSQQYPVLGEGDATFVKQMSTVTSEDEDPICISKILKVERKNFETSSYASSFEKSSMSKGSYLEPFSKHLNSSSTYPKDNTVHRTKTSDNEFSPRRKLESVNTSSIEEGCLQDLISNTTFKVSELELSPRSRSDSNRVTPPSYFRKPPRIFPPLDKNYLSSTLETSDKISPSKNLDLPEIMSPSSVVESNIQKVFIGNY